MLAGVRDYRERADRGRPVSGKTDRTSRNGTSAGVLGCLECVAGEHY